MVFLTKYIFKTGFLHKLPLPARLKKKRNRLILNEITKPNLRMTASMKILFCLPASALRDSFGNPRTLHTFANHTGSPTNQNLQKSAISLPSSFIQIVEL